MWPVSPMGLDFVTCLSTGLGIPHTWPSLQPGSVRGKDLLGISQDTHPGSRLHGAHTCSSALWVLGGLPRLRTKGSSCPGLRHGVRTQVSGLWPLLFLPPILSCSDLMHVSASTRLRYGPFQHMLTVYL